MEVKERDLTTFKKTYEDMVAKNSTAWNESFEYYRSIRKFSREMLFQFSTL